MSCCCTRNTRNIGMKKTAFFSVIFAFFLTFGANAGTRDVSIEQTLKSGDRIHFDGSTYDFRSKAGVEMIKLWVPPGQVVRGILISGHGGGGGDSREFARYESLRHFAARIGFGLAGLHNFPGGKVFEHGGPLFFRALDAFAAMGQHPELSNIPFAMYGSSNGGASTYGFVNAAPKRALCFLSNVSSWFTPSDPVPDALKVPGVVDVGMYDTFGKDRGVVNALAQVHKARALGARWAVIVEQKGHEDGVSFDLYMKLVERALALRYPTDADPRKGSVALKDVPEEAGWLADDNTFGNGITTVASYADYAGDRKQASWLLDRDFAFTYQAASTWDSPVALQLKNIERVANPHVDPATMFSIGGPVIDLGKAIEVTANVRDIADWQRVEFYDGAKKLGEVRAPRAPGIRFTVDAKRPVQTLSALVFDRQGRSFPTLPFHYFIRDPKVQTQNESERSTNPFTLPNVADGSGSTTSPSEAVAKFPGAHLVAHGLTAEQEIGFSQKTGQPASFWRSLPADAVVLDAKNSGAEGSAFSIVHNADINVTVKAAHSRRGLYLYFEITDDRFIDSIGESYNSTDAIEVLLDGQSSAVINTPEKTAFLNPGWGLTLSTRQYQVATGGVQWPTAMRRNLPSPWDMAYKTWSLADAKQRFGIVVRHSKQGRMKRVQEWFLPWSELSGGTLADEPAVGTALGLALGYNDQDTQGGPVKRLRWVDKKGPWRSAGSKGQAPRGWGDLVVGPIPAAPPSTAAR
jgi:hypothetical protein